MDTPTVCDLVVKPDGFAISPEATQKHRLPHDVAVATGTPLREALRSMLGDVLDVCGRGGRLVAHHLEFPAGLISEELGRAGLGDMKETWAEVVRRGICTMDPDVAGWVRRMIGAPGDYVVPMRLTDAFGGLVGDRKELLQGHHSADNDAAMCWFLCKELASRCASD